MRSTLSIAILAIFLTGALASMSFTIYGDWGVANSWSGKMAVASEKKHSKFILALGDNFYKEHSKAHPTRMGVTSATDPKWKRVFENVYTHKFFKNTWYVCAGNHDYNGNEHAQLEYAKTHKRWYMPSFYYTFSKKIGGVDADFFVLDTTPLYYSDKELKKTFRYTKGKDTAQIKWLASALKASKASWKFVMAHHQILTAHGGNAWMHKQITPLLKKHKVAAYINGHIHSVQHVKDGGVHYLTIGNGAFQKPASGSKRALWTYPKSLKGCANAGCTGFAIMTVSNKKSAAVTYYNRKGKALKKIGIKNPN